MIGKLTINKLIWRGMLVFFLYIILGAIIPFLRQPVIAEETKVEVEQTSFYGDDYTSERAYLLIDNEQALEERIRMISQAEDRIILSTFQFYADNSGKAIMSSLLDAAERGVRVQIVLDGVNQFAQFRELNYFYVLANADNIELKVYNPISLIRPWSINGRLHDKYLIVDKNLYILGGRNIFDYFLGNKTDYKNIDWDVVVYNSQDNIAKSMVQLTNYFNEIWNAPESKTIENKVNIFNKRRVDRAEKELKEIHKQLKKSQPEWFEATDYYEKSKPVKNIELLVNPITPYAKEPIVFYTITQLMQDGKEEVKFHTPYFIYNKWMRQEVEAISKKVPNTTMMINSVANNGNPFGAADYLFNKSDIIDTGIQVLEYDGGISYHGKCFTIDDRLSGIGAFNWDMRSTYIDTETMLVIDSEELNKDLKNAMEKYEEEALIVVDKDNYIVPQGMTKQEVSLGKKLILGLVGIFSKIFRFLL